MFPLDGSYNSLISFYFDEINLIIVAKLRMIKIYKYMNK